MKRKNQVKTVSRRTAGRIVGYGSIGLLLLLAFIMINPSAERDSYATCLDGTGEGECAVSALTQEVGVTTKTAIALATASEVKLPDVTPTSAGATSYASTKLAVSTNSKEGYSIFLQTGTVDGSLVGVTSSMDDTGKITNTKKTGTLLSNLETNSYGYALSTVAINENTTYSHVPTSSTVIYNKSSNTEMGDGAGDYPYGDEYYLAFGTKISTSLPAGTYAGTVTVSAVANPLTVTSLYDISMMQEMTSSICENTREGYTKQLIDTRDGKSYWVAKLKDGNCWMTQNLALDIALDNEGNAAALSESGTKVTLDESNSDMSGRWGQDAEIKPFATNSVPITGQDSPDLHARDTGLSWNLGKVVLATPTLGKRCNGEDGNALQFRDPQKIEEVCNSAGFVSVAGDEWQPGYSVQDGVFTYNDGSTYSGMVSVKVLNSEEKRYDSHYLIGNYYKYITATAGVTTDFVYDNADSSICPRSWKLPKAGILEGYPALANNNKNGSYYNLLRAYGLQDRTVSTDTANELQVWENQIFLPGDVSAKVTIHAGEYNIATAPLYFVRSGIANGTVQNAEGKNVGDVYANLGYEGVAWSNTATSEANAMDLYFHSTWVGPAVGWYGRQCGMPIRCLAR